MAIKIPNVNKTSDYGRYHDITDRHPLITVIDFSEVSPIHHSLNRYVVYGIFVQEDNGLELMYGCGGYDYRDGLMICVSPGQIGGKDDNGERVSIGGWSRYIARMRTFYRVVTRSGWEASRAVFILSPPLVTLQRLISSPSTSSIFRRPITVRASFPAIVLTR